MIMFNDSEKNYLNELNSRRHNLFASCFTPFRSFSDLKQQVSHDLYYSSHFLWQGLVSFVHSISSIIKSFAFLVKGNVKEAKIQAKISGIFAYSCLYKHALACLITVVNLTRYLGKVIATLAQALLPSSTQKNKGEPFDLKTYEDDLKNELTKNDGQVKRIYNERKKMLATLKKLPSSTQKNKEEPFDLKTYEDDLKNELTKNVGQVKRIYNERKKMLATLKNLPESETTSNLMSELDNYPDPNHFNLFCAESISNLSQGHEKVKDLYQEIIDNLPEHDQVGEQRKATEELLVAINKNINLLKLMDQKFPGNEQRYLHGFIHASLIFYNTYSGMVTEYLESRKANEDEHSINEMMMLAGYDNICKRIDFVIKQDLLDMIDAPRSKQPSGTAT